MVMEDYVSFETAKLLKEKGFDGPCFRYAESKEIYESGNWTVANVTGGCVGVPTLQMAVKWVQEAHNIIIIPNYEYECDSTPWCYKIFKLKENGKPEKVAVKGVSYDKDNNPTEHIVGYRDYERSYKDYSTKEEAIEEGIKYCLENLI